jgi:Flp pilus assembly pilin Flp
MAATETSDPQVAKSTTLGESTTMKNALLCFVRDEEGQDLIEYTLLMAFIALASAAIFVGAGSSVSSIWKSASNQLSNAAANASS